MAIAILMFMNQSVSVYQSIYSLKFQTNMKTRTITGEGIQGMNINVSVIDMVALSNQADGIERVIANHKAIEEYHNTPYDKRVDENGNKLTCPAKIELPDEELIGLAHFLRKCAGSFAASEVFSDVYCMEDDLCE